MHKSGKSTTFETRSVSVSAVAVAGAIALCRSQVLHCLHRRVFSAWMIVLLELAKLNRMQPAYASLSGCSSVPIEDSSGCNAELGRGDPFKWLLQSLTLFATVVAAADNFRKATLSHRMTELELCSPNTCMTSCSKVSHVLVLNLQESCKSVGLFFSRSHQMKVLWTRLAAH